MLSPQEAITMAARIVSELGAVPARDALEVLQLATGEVLRQAGHTGELARELDCAVVRSKRRLSRIEQDDELRMFIHSFTARDSIEKIAQACAAKFGAERAPSKTSVHRYLQALKYRGRARK